MTPEFRAIVAVGVGIAGLSSAAVTDRRKP